MDWTDFVIPLLLFAFAFAGLATVWATRKAEERRLRVQRQQRLIQTWRGQLLSALREEISRDEFLRLPAYSTLRPHLSEEFKRRCETGNSTLNVSDGPLRLLLIGEIARIERDWKVI